MKTLRPEPPQGPGAESWLLPFAVVNLLLAAVFLVLNTLSQNDLKKLREDTRVAKSQSAPMVGPIGLTAVADVADDPALIEGTTSPERLPPQLRRLATSLSRSLKMFDNERACLGADKRGLVLNISSSVFFRPGSSIILKQANPLLDALGMGLGNLPNQIIIQGYADEKALSEADTFSGSWQLATDRNLSLIQHLVENNFVAANRISTTVSGIAPALHAAGLTLESHRFFTSRIDLVVLDK